MNAFEKDEDLVVKIEISMYKNGQIYVNGPIDHPPFFFDLMNKAERIILNRWHKAMQKKEASRIVVPDMKVQLH